MKISKTMRKGEKICKHIYKKMRRDAKGREKKRRDAKRRERTQKMSTNQKELKNIRKVRKGAKICVEVEEYDENEKSHQHRIMRKNSLNIDARNKIKKNAKSMRTM